MAKRRVPARVRAWLLLVTLLLPLAAGCFEDDPGVRRAVPTDKPSGPPVPTRPTSEVLQLNYNDPGYAMPTAWRVGDGWDWESDKNRYRTMRVVEERPHGAGTAFLVEETAGVVGNPPNSRSRTWIENGTWMRLNLTDVQGWLTVYKPGVPLRFAKNGTYNLTAETFDQRGRKVDNVSVYTNVAYTNNGVVIRLPWGNVATAKLEYRTVTVQADKSQTRTMLTRWMERDLANDVRYEDAESGETFTLVAAKVGGRTLRELRAT